MLRKLLLALILLPLAAFAFGTHARAQSLISTDDLSGALLTRGELNYILDAAGIDATFTTVNDLSPQTGDRVGVCRIYGTNSGYAAAICLYANADGSRASSDLQNTILSGDAIQNVVLNTSLVDSIDSFQLQGGLSNLGDASQLATFTAVSSGVNLDMIGGVFLQGPVAAYVYLGDTSQADPTVLGGIMGAQSAKLPGS